MIKTVTINLANQVFQIDENAFEVLQKYIQAIRNRFVHTEGKEEIISDIESRIAEMLQEKKSPVKQSITLSDVEAIMAAMGKPEQFETEENANTESSKNETKDEKIKRRFFRNEDDKVIAGVCSGLASYLGIDDPLWIRVAMVIFLIAGFGSAFWVYIILWIIVPKAKTASDKLQMQGKPVTIEGIEKTITEDLEDFKKTVQNSNTTSSARSVFAKLIDAAIDILKFSLKIVGKLFALFAIGIGVVLAIILVLGFLMPFSFLGISFPELFEAVFDNQWQIVLGSVGIMLLIGIPAFSLIFSGIKSLLGMQSTNKKMTVTLVIAWVVGLFMCFNVGFSIAASFSKTDTIEEKLVLTTTADTLILKPEKMSSNKDEDQFVIGTSDFEIDEAKGKIIADAAMVNVLKSENDETYLVTQKSASGKTKQLAFNKAKAIVYNAKTNNATIIFPNEYVYDLKDKFRMQEVAVTLYIPEGKTIFLSKGMENIIYDVDNVTNTYDGDMIGHYWKMMPEGLTCISCNSKGNANDNYISYDLADFNAIQINGNLNVEITQGDSYSFKVEGNENFTKNFNAQKEGNKLIIASEFNWKNIFSSKNAGTVYITTPVLNSIEINGLNKTKIQNFKNKSLTININGASDNIINVETENLELSVSGAADINMKGSSKKASINLSGASNIEAYNFEATNMQLDIAGAGNAEVWAKEKLTVDLSGAAKVTYKGNPKITSSVSGGSSIKKME